MFLKIHSEVYLCAHKTGSQNVIYSATLVMGFIVGVRYSVYWVI